MVCEVSATGFCARHGRVHGPDELRWALDASSVGEGFRREWDRALATAATALGRVEPRSTCRYLTEAPLDRGGCGSCPAKWVYPCEVFGRCSPAGYHPGVKRCSGCEHHTARGADAPEPEPVRLVLESPAGVAAVALEPALAALHVTHPARFVTAVTGPGAEWYDFHPRVVAAEPELGPWRPVRLAFPSEGECPAGAELLRACGARLEAALGVSVALAADRPQWHPAPHEVDCPAEVREAIGGRPYWLIDPGTGDRTSSAWVDSQRVVDTAGDRFAFVQVGDGSEPLAGALDLRGRRDLRWLARAVGHARGGVGAAPLAEVLCAALGKPYFDVARPERVAVPGGSAAGAERAVRLAAAILAVG